eukprot:7005240-Prymnesium_polylepis.1
MDVVAKADRLARAGQRILHLEVGQPQSSAPKAAIATAQQQMASDRCGYTAARGEPPLRSALAAMYKRTYGVDVSAGEPASDGASHVSASLGVGVVGSILARATTHWPSDATR